MKSEWFKEAYWMQTALAELGVEEVVGPGNDPRVLEYHDETKLNASRDAVPWCSSFVNWVCKQRKIPGTASAAARSWQRWGRPTTRRLGCVVVLKRGINPKHGHVGFWMGEDRTGVYVLGGNQGNAVSIRRYGKWRVLKNGYRWPE